MDPDAAVGDLSAISSKMPATAALPAGCSRPKTAGRERKGGGIRRSMALSHDVKVGIDRPGTGEKRRMPLATAYDALELGVAKATIRNKVDREMRSIRRRFGGATAQKAGQALPTARAWSDAPARRGEDTDRLAVCVASLKRLGES